ncbi:MAG: hypothetical protein COA52_15535 [Hyphomicrobiales bacterium]|nr:MAG: hypothetical protein COA52_15535 [Hyphomicrobiales bacterium]
MFKNYKLTPRLRGLLFILIALFVAQFFGIGGAIISLAIGITGLAIVGLFIWTLIQGNKNSG